MFPFCAFYHNSRPLFQIPDPRKMHWALGSLLVSSVPSGVPEEDRPWSSQREFSGHPVWEPKTHCACDVRATTQKGHLEGVAPCRSDLGGTFLAKVSVLPLEADLPLLDSKVIHSQIASGCAKVRPNPQ